MTVWGYLTDDEWETINVQLPDINLVVNQVSEWPVAEYIGFGRFDMNATKIEQFRLSSACYRDARRNVQGARFALGQALGVKKLYHINRVPDLPDDSNEVLGHFYGQFYADYVPLLLYSAAEHALKGLFLLYGFEVGERKGKPWLKHTIKRFEEEDTENTTLLAQLRKYDRSQSRDTVFRYRNDWVHNRNQRVATGLYDQPRFSFVRIESTREEVVFGGKVVPKFTWDDFIQHLKIALSDTLAFMAACFDDWEQRYGFQNDNE